MAKINTTNYQPVSAWNGTQDLFIVEQPDGTKVATPKQVKQYVEAGDFEATGEVKDGHGNILAKKLEIQNNAAFHNSIYRGKSLGTEVTQEQWDAISSGTFDDMYVGDYWIINGVIWRIAGFDYWINNGDATCTTHHVVIVADSNLDTQNMNTINTTSGGYVGSDMYTTNMATAKGKVMTAFGSAHILSHREFLTNATTSGYASAGAWYDSDIELMNEVMVYGTDFFTPHNSLGATIPNTYTVDTAQLPLFALDHSRICNRARWWLRDVVSGTFFASVSDSGYCACYPSFNVLGVRPAFGIKA